jgi:hypothetical protein
VLALDEASSMLARSVLLEQTPTPERCLEAYYLQRTRLELIVERKVRRLQLTRRWQPQDHRPRST